MDVNGTRHHAVLGARDWLAVLDTVRDAGTVPADERLAWDPRRRSVSLQRRLFRFPPRPSERPFTPAHRRGADRDRFGHHYWIGDDGREIRYRPAAGRRGARFWSVDDLEQGLGPGGDAPPPAGDFQPVAPDPPPPPPTLSGLAVTTRHYLVVGTVDPGGLLVFDLFGGGPPRWRLWPEEIPFEPFDLAAGPNGGLWVLDQVHLRLWRLDRDLRVVRAGDPVEVEPASRDDFHPLGGEPRQEPARIFPTGWSPALASPVTAADAVALTVLSDDSVLLLEPAAEDDDARIHRLWNGRPLGDSVSVRELLEDLLEDDASLLGHDLAFLPTEADPGEVAGTLYVVPAEGNQAYAFDLAADVLGHFELRALDLYLPLRGFAGKALVDDGTDIFYDHDDEAETWLSVNAVPRPRFHSEGELDRLTFDGGKPGCVWHRLRLDAFVPPGDSITVESRAADDEDDLEQVPWSPEPRPGLRPTGSELPWVHTMAPEGAETRPGEGTWELLFQNAVGRHLELRLIFAGSGRSTPRLRSLRVSYPRFSYLDHYLPTVYRQDPVSASFLDRFLANFEGIYTEIEGRIAQVQTLFDPRTTPTDALDWLASWLGAVLDSEWDEARRRLFLQHAAELFRRRGSPRGLLQAIRLSVDPCPDAELLAGTRRVPFGIRLVESFRTRQLPKIVLGEPTDPAVAPALVAADEPWTPAQGGAQLHGMWRAFLGREQPKKNLSSALFPPRPPADPLMLSLWRRFVRSSLEFSYAEVTDEDDGAWRSYLTRRYRHVEELRRAWGSGDQPTSFDAVELPRELPPDGAALRDWIRFVSLTLPLARDAHRFSVLVPVAPEQSQAERHHQLAKVEDVVEREKPAHTAFEVRPYWALFRVGTARVGHDTLLGEGSRLTAITLGAGYLGEGLLTEEHPETRRIVGRDSIGEPPPLA